MSSWWKDSSKPTKKLIPYHYIVYNPFFPKYSETTLNPRTLTFNEPEINMRYIKDIALQFAVDFPKFPKVINFDDLPPELKELEKIQKLIMNYNSDDENQTKEIISYFEKCPNLGLQQLEICINIRPNRVKHYAHLYLNLPTNIRLFARLNLSISNFFQLELLSQNPRIYAELKCMECEDYYFKYNYLISQICQEVKFPSGIFTHEMLDAIIKDDPDYFTNFLANYKDLNFRHESSLQIGYSLINLFALFGSINCFKLFMMNNAKMEGTDRFAIAGGNLEIVRILSQKNKFRPSHILALYYRQDEIYNWQMENYPIENGIQPYLYMTETLSIHAMHALTTCNKYSNFIEILITSFLDNKLDICKFFAKFSYFNEFLFYFLNNEEILDILLENIPEAIFDAVINCGINNKMTWGLEYILTNKIMNKYILKDDFIDNIRERFRDSLFEKFTNYMNSNFIPENGYKYFLKDVPIAKENAFSLAKCCYEKFNFNGLFKLVGQYLFNFTNEQLIELCKICPYNSFVISNVYNKGSMEKEIINILVRFYFPKIPSSNLVNQLKTQNIEIYEQLNPFEIINLCQINSMSDLRFLDVLKSKNLIDDYEMPEFNHVRRTGFMSINGISQSTDNNNNLPRVHLYNNDIISIDSMAPLIPFILDSVTFKRYFQIHYEEFGYLLYSLPDLISLLDNIELSKPLFNKVLNAYMYNVQKNEKFGRDGQEDRFIKLLTSPLNRHHINVHEFQYDQYHVFLKHVHFTESEYKFLKDNVKDFDLTYNPENAEHMTFDEFISPSNRNNQKNFLKYIKVTPKIIQYLNDKNVFKQIITKESITRPEILQVVDTDLLIDFIMSHRSFDPIILNELFNRDLTSKKLDFIKLAVKSELPIFMNYFDRMPQLYQIYLSIQLKQTLLPKETKLNIDSFIMAMENFNPKDFTNRFNYYMEHYTITKEVLTQALFNKLDENMIEEFVKHGAYINAVINGTTPLLNSIKFGLGENFVKAGAYTGYKINTYWNAARTAKNVKCDPSYECRFHYSEVSRSKIITAYTVSLDPILGLMFKSSRVSYSKYKNTWDASEMNLDGVKMVLGGLFRILQLTSQFDNLFTPFDRSITLHFPPRRAPKLNEEKIQDELKSYPHLNNVYCVLTQKNNIVELWDNHFLLYLATRIGNIETIRALLEKGADINKVEGYFCYYSPSLEAVCKYRPDILSLFIEYGLNVNQIYSAEDTTLLNACILYNSYECFELIVDKASLEHVVTLSPMSCALMQYSEGNKYYFEKLIGMIDIELERIESPQFVLFESLKAMGKDYKNDKSVLKFRDGYHKDEYDGSYVAQRILPVIGRVYKENDIYVLGPFN